MNDRIGMNTTSESPAPYRSEASAPADKSEPSSSKVDELLEQATTALRQGVEAAWKVHARAAVRESIQEAPTTRAPEVVSPFTARLTLYSGLIGTLVSELSSIAPLNPVMDASSSSRPQESQSSSPRVAEPFSRSNGAPRIGSSDQEPPVGSVVLDSDGDSWQRDYDGWDLAGSSGGSGYRGWTWARLCERYVLRLIYRND